MGGCADVLIQSALDRIIQSYQSLANANQNQNQNQIHSPAQSHSLSHSLNTRILYLFFIFFYPAEDVGLDVISIK